MSENQSGWQQRIARIAAELRHAYLLLNAGAVGDQRKFANGVLAPQIKELEKFADGQNAKDAVPPQQGWKTFPEHDWTHPHGDPAQYLHCSRCHKPKGSPEASWNGGACLVPDASVECSLPAGEEGG